MIETTPEQFNWKRFTALLGTSCLLGGIGMGTIIYYVTPPGNILDSSGTVQQTSPTPVKDLKIKGNKNSMIYHLPRCASYNRIADKNVVWFKTKEEAEAAGYRMAKNC